MGLFLLFVTLGLEALGAVWSYYFGVHYAAGLAGMLTALFTVFHRTGRAPVHVTTVDIGRLWVAGYVLVHLGAVVGYVKATTKKRLKLGRPGPREIETVDRIYRQLAVAVPPPGFARVSRLRWPRAFSYAPGYGMTLSFLGFRLVIDEGLFRSPSLKPLLAQQLFAYNSGDVLQRVVFACLSPLGVYIMPLCAIWGLPLGMGPFVTLLWWKKYWRDRVYAADRFAVWLGQGPDLIDALEQMVRPRERSENLFVREVPYASERIGRLERMLSARFSRRTSPNAGPAPSGEASQASGSPRFEQAQWGWSSAETPTASSSSAPFERTGPSTGPAPRTDQSSSTARAEASASASGGRYEEWLKKQAASQARDATGDSGFAARTTSDEGKTQAFDWDAYLRRSYAASKRTRSSGPRRS